MATTSNSIRGSWRVQWRVIHALIMREILTRYGRHNIGFLWLFVEPMMFTLGVTTLWTMMKATHGSNLPIAAFALTGYSTVLLWRNMPSRTICAIEPNLALMYHRNVKVLDIFISRILLEAMGATISFSVLSIVLIYSGLIDPPEDILLVIAGWLMTAWFGAALGLFIGALSAQSELVDKFWHPTSYLLFPLSGAAFLVESLPKEMQEPLLFLPMVHGVELLREGYFGSQFKPHHDIPYMATICLLLTLFGLAQIRKISREVIPQ